MKKQFSEIKPEVNFADVDKKVHAIWERCNVFKRTEELSTSDKHYVFYDGPPGTNGRPHIGHIMQSALKDLWPRFKTMQGYKVMRKAGWDTHGLPVELTAESELGLSGKVDIEKYGVSEFVEYCRKIVLRYRDDWVAAIKKVGRFLDCDNDYLTMSNEFIQSDWAAIKVAFDKNLLYRDYKIVPFCCRCGTGLSSHEVAQGYKDVTDLTLTAKFKLKSRQDTYLLAWTTTPWTLLGNIAVAVGPEIQYSKIEVKRDNGSTEYLILATDLVEANKKALGSDYKVVETFLGTKLQGEAYEPLWEAKISEDTGDRWKIVVDDYVTASDGTGAVHLALYGEDDFRLIRQHGFAEVQHIGADGKVKDGFGPFTGREFFDENLAVDIVKDLARTGLLFDKYRHEHSYPHCWRCSTRLMYFATTSWFIKTTAYKDLMLSENDKINWQPPHISKGRFGNWLENNVDWAVTRDRYWGTPLNVWAAEGNEKDRICVESVEQLVALGATFDSTGKPVPADIDLHIPTIDDVVISRDGKKYRREKGVLDCWFNAGNMPWGQFGYPVAKGSKEKFEKQFPADFICEAIDQTRGWFYTLLAVSCLVEERTCFKNVICTELILDSHGKKMSKSLGNVIAPLPLIDEFGADAVRWTFYNSNPWQVKRYSAELPKEALRAVFIPIWNCYSFFVTYANLDGWTPAQKSGPSQYELDRWIISALSTAISNVTAALENYDVANAANSISDFIEALSNWYIRRSRRRFWKSESDADKSAAYSTLYEVLVTLSKLIAPMAPFIAEEMYQNLVRTFDGELEDSVHLCTWPDAKDFAVDSELEEEIAVIQEAASLCRALRKASNLKVRQPLGTLILFPVSEAIGSKLEGHFDALREEINVKEVLILENQADFIEFKVKPDWRKLGPKFGKDMKALAAAIEALDPKAVRASIDSENELSIVLNGSEVKIGADDLIWEHKAKPGTVAEAGRKVTVSLSTELTPELICEGFARELVSVIQRNRRELNFNIADRIDLQIWGGQQVAEALNQHGDYVARECLVEKLDFQGNLEVVKSDNGSSIDVNGEAVKIVLVRA